MAIIGAGPSGLLLSQLLHRQGIDSIVLERRSRQHVEQRIRAGVLEWGTVELLTLAGVGERMRSQGLRHDGFTLAFEGETHRIDLQGLAGSPVLVYGQTEIQKDLTDARLAAGGNMVWEAQEVSLDGLDSPHPSVSCRVEGRALEIECDFIAGCDGSHGVSRASIPRHRLTEHERTYPCGWLGVLVDSRPLADELVYASGERGFALCSMRSRSRSRYYLQCARGDRIEDWPDGRFWSELTARLPAEYAAKLVTAASIEKSIVPLRSLVTEPMRFGRLFLAGDAAHIVPPTGAKGLNLAAADVRILSAGLAEHYRSGSDTLLNEYSSLALARVWKATRFSWWLTTLTHRFSEEAFARKLQLAELAYIRDSQAASRTVAENYVGLPFPECLS